MGRLHQTVNLLVVVTLLTGLVLTWPLGDAGFPALAQDTPPPAEDQSAFPPEIALGDRYFLFDRVLPFGAEGLVEVGQQGDLIVFAETAEAPFDRVYVSVPDRSETVARYLPEIPVGSDGVPLAANACLSQPMEFGDLETGDGVYAYAGPDDEIPLDDLTSIGTTEEGYSVYADPEQQPSPEILVDTGAGVFRFVLLDNQGRPPVLGDSLQFGGITFAYADDESGVVDPATLAPVGCAGPFPLAAPVDQADTGALTQLFATVDDRLFAYTATGDPAAGTDQEEPADEPAVAEDASTPEETTGETVAADTESTPTGEAPAGVEQPATQPAPGDEEATDSAQSPEPDDLDTEAAPTDAVTEPTPAVDLPLAVTLDSTRFSLDRVVPIDLQGLEPVGEGDGILLFALTGGPPFERVYGAPDAAADRAGRYLAEQPIDPAGTCVAETASFTLLAVGDDQYAYAGPEPDLTPDQLQAVFQTSEDQPVYAETPDQPVPELYVETDGVLSRFVHLDERGVPVTIGDAIAFAGQRFAFDRDSTGEVDPNALSFVGCVGPFPARAEEGAGAEGFGQIFVLLNDETPRVLAFVATDSDAEPATAPAAEPASPTVAPVEQPTEIPSVISTATLAPPTEAPIPPTETPAPPTVTMVPPTETPLPPTATIAPPVASPPPVITTEVPATEAPPETPSAEATPAPATATPAPPSDVAPTPLTAPTVAPPETPVSDIPVDAPAPIPEELPREIEVQGIRYLFDLEVDIDPQSLVQVDVVQTPRTTLTIFASPDDQVGSARLSWQQGALLGPFGRVYAVSSATGVVVRYASEAPITTAGTIEIAAPCSAEANAQTFSYTFESQQFTYVFASVETHVSIEELRTSTVAALGEVPRADDGREVLVRAGGYPGLAEVFLAGGGDLERYIALNAAGAPVTLNNLLFAETRFRYEAQVSVTVTDSAFRRIGCAGPFPLFAPTEQADAAVPLRTSFTVIDTRVYQFIATEIVIAPTGQSPAPPTIVAPPPGFVQITLETTIVIGPTPTPLPNIRVVPLPTAPGASPTPASGLIVELPERQRRCQGDPGAIDANGLPERLPARIQLSGIAYRFIGQEETANDIRLRRIGCVGPFEAVQAEGTGVGRVVYLRSDRTVQTLYRYEAITSFAVNFVVGGDARVITSGNQRYVLDETWQRSIYSSVTVIVYAQDPAAAAPPRVFAVQVDGDVIAEYIPEGGDVVEAPAELRAQAEAVGINPDLVLGGGQRYLLVNLWLPIGTTTNGWVTLYAIGGDGVADTLLATDPRSLDLFVYGRPG